MTYSTALKMVRQFGAKELAEVAAPKDRALLPDTVLRKHVNGESITDEDPDVQLAAAEAVARIENAIAEAEGIADAYIGSGGYTTPLSTVPEYISGAVEDIARWLLHKENPSEAVIERNRQARAMLDRVASGKMLIVEADGDTAAQSSSSRIAVSGPDEVFTESVLGSFMGRL
jgi:phage gp36-like protein